MAELEVTITVALTDAKGLTGNGARPSTMTFTYVDGSMDNVNYYPNTVRGAIKKAAELATASLGPNYVPERVVAR